MMNAPSKLNEHTVLSIDAPFVRAVPGHAQLPPTSGVGRIDTREMRFYGGWEPFPSADGLNPTWTYTYLTKIKPNFKPPL